MSHSQLLFARSIRLRIVQTAAAAALAIGCGNTEPYRIGVVLDDDGLRGAQLAAADVNANGGIHGHPLELRSMPGAGSTKAKVALETARTLAADPGILAVVGHTSSSASLAASPVYDASGIVLIAPTTTTPHYGIRSPFSFRLVASDVHQGVFLADQALALSRGGRIAIVYVNDDYGRPLRTLVLARLRAAGVEPVYDGPYSEGDRATNHEIVEALARMKPDQLIWIGQAVEYASHQPAMRTALPNLTVMASDGFGGPALQDDPQHVFDGVRYVRLVDFQLADSALSRFTAGYRQQGLAEPSDQAVLSYDAVRLLAAAIGDQGPNRTAIREWLSEVGRARPAFKGLSGPVVFDASGDRSPQYFLVRIGAAGAGAVHTSLRGALTTGVMHTTPSP